MATKPKVCGRCSGAMSLATLDKVTAADGPLRLNLAGLPVFSCPKGHHAPAHRDFMVWLLHEVRDKHALSIPGGEAKGMLFKKYHCACGRELEPKSAKRQSFPLELAYQGAPAFKAEMEMPIYKCTGCGKEQLRSVKELQGHTAQAIAALNDAAGFPHSG